MTSSAIRRALAGMVIGLALQPLGQPQGLRDAVPFLLAELQAARWSRCRVPSTARAGDLPGAWRSARGRRARVLADANENALACGPRTRNGAGLHLLEQLLVHALGRAPQGELAQRCQVGRREIVLERPLGLLGNVDLAFLQALDQVVGREIHELDGIRTIENGIGHDLAHAHARDLRDDVVEALDVLDVDRGVDVDAGIQQLLHILVALGVAAARQIGVGELVDQDQARTPLEGSRRDRTRS